MKDEIKEIIIAMIKLGEIAVITSGVLAILISTVGTHLMKLSQEHL